ncbi:hypothetical protein D4R30_00250 [archaeon]|nr:MAG: hypothetical protein D4R30_00250 [archaeon]
MAAAPETGPKGRKARPALKAHRVRPATDLVRKAPKVRKGSRERRDFKDLVVPPDRLDRLVIRGWPGRRDQPVPPVRPVCKDPKVRRVRRELKVRSVLKDPSVLRDTKGLRAPRAPPVVRA